MTFYIDSFMPGTADTPSIVTVTLPNKTSFKALLASEISIQMNNRFGNLLPGTEMLSDIAQLIGSVNIPGWIGASVQGWRGTDPIKFNIEMYLVNYKPKLGYESKLRELAKLATISPGEGMNGGASHLTYQVHGGYNPDAFASNKYQFIDNSSVANDPNISGLLDNDQKKKQLGVMEAAGNDALELAKKGANHEGTLTIRIGTRFQLNNLLMTSLNITPSVVEVYSPTAGEQPKPLYYKVSISVMTCRAALFTDVEKMFR